MKQEHNHHEECCCHEHSHESDHGQGGGCSCCAADYSNLKIEEKSFITRHRNELICLVAGALFFAAGLLLEHTVGRFVIPVCLASYIILGHNVLIASFKNICKGKVFDENFLMSVATIAAFCIGDYPEAAGVMLFYNVGELFEHISVDRSREKIAKAVDMRPENVTIIGFGEDGIRENVIPAADAKVGDIIIIKPGDRIPLDGEITDGEALIDTAPVTGEPEPVRLMNGDCVLSGCIVKRGQIIVRVTAPLEESMVSRILESVENAAEGKPQIEKFITKFARIYTPIIVVLAVLVAIVPPVFLGAAWKQWIITAVTFLVISCPCAMVISVPLAFFLGVGCASKMGILVKSGQVLEAMRKIKIVAFDKTGTLTKGTVEDSALMEIGEESGNFKEAFAKKRVSGDALKDDAKSGVQMLKKMNIISAMLTGDREDRAFEIGDEAGIDRKNIRAQLFPNEKLGALRSMRRKHGPIMFVGDGINDAPVLTGADVGGAMGSGADAAIESADVVFMNSTVESVPNAIKIARRTGVIAKENIILALAIKLIVIALGLAGFANIWLAVFADTGVAIICILNSLRISR